MPQIEYLAQAQKLADSGYVVVSYTSRGFWLSGGEIEWRGHRTSRTPPPSSTGRWSTPPPTRPHRHGGVSYGAGISLLAAGHDPRVKAVAALSGWPI